MKRVLILPSFEHSIKKLTSQKKKQLAKSLETFNNFLLTGKNPSGLRFKKINHDKYEFRVDISLRVVVKREGGDFYLILVGDHDDIKQYLRHFR